MIVEYVTNDGSKLRVGRVDRRLLDDLELPMKRPEPPTREVVVWDGSTEHVKITDDQKYLDQLALYYMELRKHQFGVVETAVEIMETPQIHADADEQEALRAIGVVGELSALERVLGKATNRESAREIIELIFFNSTVTERGIERANNKIGAKWEGLPVSSYRLKPQFPINVSQYYIDRVAASHYGFKWNEFCDLWGYEQAEYVALYLTENALEYMKYKHMEANAK